MPEEIDKIHSMKAKQKELKNTIEMLKNEGRIFFHAF